MQHTRKTRSLLAVLVAAALTMSGCSLLPTEVEEAPPVVAPPQKTDKATYTARKGSIEEKITLRAIYAPVRAADLFWKSGGRVKAVYVKAGDKVAAGDLLAEMYADDAVYQAAQARIRHEKAQIALEDARQRAQYKGEQALGTEIRRLELDLESARLDAERYQTLVADSRLVAPFAGQIMGVETKPGDSIAGYAIVMSVADPTELWVEADVDDSQLTRLSVGQKARLEFSDVPDVTGGTVVQLPDPRARATAPAGQAKRIKVQVDKVSEKAKMGAVGKVHVVLQEKKDVLLLQNAAIRKFGNRTNVQMKEPRREVDVVLGIEGEMETEVVRGLKEGDVVVGR